MDRLKFGTSGLRGLVTDLAGWPAFAYSMAFGRALVEKELIRRDMPVLVGRDLRCSSLEISRQCIAGIEAAGLKALDCDALPTPALALSAVKRNSAAIMVTGSHIPDDRNGLKFYRPDGEITKDDEAGILEALAKLRPANGQDIYSPTAMDDGGDAIEDYVVRSTDFFSGALQGLTVGVYQHSSVARDILVRIIEGCGATAVPLGRADRFIPVDTEALRDEDVALAARWAAETRLDAIVSTDGDADRPLIADETGIFVRGDLIGLITALHLSADAIVTPITSNSAIERDGLKVMRTKIGSPFVIEGIKAAAKVGARCVVGFEPNGGVLLGGAVTRNGRVLEPLSTRDAMLPIISVLAAAKERSIKVSALVSTLNANTAAAHRLQNVPSEASTAFIRRLAEDRIYTSAFVADVGEVAAINLLDGARIALADGGVIHFRASGNAPELRCYVEAADEARACSLLEWGLAAARRAL